MAKLSVTQNEINVTLSEQEIETILTAHVERWLNLNIGEHCNDTVELKDHIETSIQHKHDHRSISLHVAELRFGRNEIEDEEHEIDIMD